MENSRRRFLKQVGCLGATAFLAQCDLPPGKKRKRPNVVFVFADQWRAEATGYNGNKDVITPFLNKLASESLDFEFAVSNTPVSTPYRGSMLTGRYAHKTGLFINDVQLDPESNSVAKSYKAAGYDTAYIGKWHVNGHGRRNYIPRKWRQGFDYFKAIECCHIYFSSQYYDNDDPEVKMWEGYDAYSQTVDAQKYIRSHAGGEKPFVLFLSWGPPHNPYTMAPKKFRDLYENRKLTLLPNVPEEKKRQTITDLKGYYAHIAALDECIGMLQKTIDESGIAEDTIFVFTSDHGDMLGSQGMINKQKPYDESIRVPFLMKYPALFGKKGRKCGTIITAVDIMPTLLGLSGIEIPSTVQGRDLSPILKGKKKDDTEAALISCISPSGEWEKRKGGREYRGVRTRKYTYVVDLKGPWLLFDNESDPYQQHNLVNDPASAGILSELDKVLQKKMAEADDRLLPGEEYIKMWKHPVDKYGTIRHG